ncbi:MAG: FimV/HubP family polar landmark protein [Pseudomonadota bacterium]
MNWPKGRLQREYTVLLDPPVTLARKPAALEAPRISTAPARQPVQASQFNPLPIGDTPSARIAPESGSREYGPIRPNDMLWEIAKTLKREGETVEQVMLALLRYNPDAFMRDNVNNLKKGMILRLPADADVTGLSHRQARREFLAQTREWRQEREQSLMTASSVQGAAPVAAVIPKSEDSDRLKLVSTKADDSDEAKDQEGKAEQAKKLSSLEQRILLIQEESESTRQENKELQTRIRELEAQLNDIQRLLTLKNDQLAELQTTQQIVAERSEPIESADERTVVTAVPSDLVDLPFQEGEVIEEVDIEAAVKEAMRSEQAVSEQPAVAAEPVITEKPEQPERPVSSPVSSPEILEKPEVALPVAQAPKKNGFLEILKDNTTLMGTVGAVAVLLIGLLWLIMRRRKEADAEFAESILMAPEGEAEAGMTSGDTGSINEPSEETSFMSDFSPSDIDALQDETGEVDPVSEADVYIAYGRYQQAEELIKQAIERYPDRKELKYKLLEIHYSAKNSDPFFQLAEELRQAGLEKEKPEIWAKIAGMGKELDPKHVLFTAAAAGIGLRGSDDELDDLGLSLDTGFAQDLGGSTSLAANEPNQETTEVSGLVDLSDMQKLDETDSDTLESDLSLGSEFLNSLDSEQYTDTPESRGEPDLLEDIDLDELEAISEFVGPESGDSLTLDPSLDVLSDQTSHDLDGAVRNTNSADEANIVGLEDSEPLEDLDLESLEKELELLSGDLEEEPDRGTEADAQSTPEEVETSSNILEFDTTDEVTTKLDLARAYVDMGDAEGAKSILEEVASEGSEEQKGEAQELLQNIPGR